MRGGVLRYSLHSPRPYDRLCRADLFAYGYVTAYGSVERRGTLPQAATRPQGKKCQRHDLGAGRDQQEVSLSLFARRERAILNLPRKLLR